MEQKRSGSARILYDCEIVSMVRKVYDSKEYSSGCCIYCLLCNDYEDNGSNVWRRFEEHLLQRHPEIIQPLLSDGRSVKE